MTTSLPKNIEVEVRGPLSLRQYLLLKDILEAKGAVGELKNRIVLDYSVFLTGGIRDRKEDIRLRATNGKPEIIVKLGEWGGNESRRELSVMTQQGSFDTLVQIFAAMGLRRAVLCVRKILAYDYHGVEFALVEVPGHSFYFEAEKLVDSQKLAVEARAAIIDVCTELGLKPFEDGKFFDYVETLNREANEVFDFADYRQNYFRQRFDL